MLNRAKYFGLAFALVAPLSAAHAERIFALSQDANLGQRIHTFDSAAPGTITSTGLVTGVATGDALTGLDLRPSNRTLYSVGTSGQLYAITKNMSGTGYTAASLGIITGATLNGTEFGTDFNPTVDRLRFVSDANQNLRINPNVMPPPAIVDGAITLGGSALVDLVGVAYTNNRPGAMTTMLFGLDALNDSLVRSTNANAGTYVATNSMGNAFGPLGVSFDATGDSRVSFDISGGSGMGYFSVADRFYSVDLMSGAGSLIGDIGVGSIVGLTAEAVPEPESWALMVAGFGLMGVAIRRRRSAIATA